MILNLHYIRWQTFCCEALCYFILSDNLSVCVWRGMAVVGERGGVRTM